ncbi:hypothetical protein JHK84_050936 [Glycine max]|nr:hypothetical protein JHK84_050936 [Glycine max]
MAQTKHALYVDGCDPFHEGLDLSHERDDAGERHQRLIASTHDRQHPPTEDHCVGHVWIWQLRLEMKLVSHGGQVLPFPIEPTVRAFVSWSRNTVKILLMTHLGINSKEEAIAATIASVGVRLLPVQANGGVEGHDTLPMQGPSLFGFWDRLTAILKVTVLCHARAFFVRFFFHFGFNIALDGKKANDGSEGDSALPCKGLLCLIFFALVLILLWTGKRLTAVLKANSSAEGDDALPWKDFLCSIFFRLGFNIALDGKEANRGAEGDDTLLDLFFISKNICDFFPRKLLFSGRLKEGEAASEKVTNNYHVLRQIE